MTEVSGSAASLSQQAAQLSEALDRFDTDADAVGSSIGQGSELPPNNRGGRDGVDSSSENGGDAGDDEATSENSQPDDGEFEDESSVHETASDDAFTFVGSQSETDTADEG